MAPVSAAGAAPTGGRFSGTYALYTYCRRCDVIHGPIGSWPQQCLTGGCGDNAEMVRVDRPEGAT